MSKILEIETCYQCCHHSLESKCRKKKGIKTKAYGIPSDCPLPNKPEPITEKDLALFWVKKLTDKEICDAINAHFLGGKP